LMLSSISQGTNRVKRRVSRGTSAAYQIWYAVEVSAFYYNLATTNPKDQIVVIRQRIRLCLDGTGYCLQ